MGGPAVHYPTWLQIWLVVVAVPASVGCLPFVTMYLRVDGRPIWEQRWWHESRIGRFLIPLPEGGYAKETWTAIRPLPGLCFVVGVGYLALVAGTVIDQQWALPVGLIVLPLLLHDLYLFDLGMDAEWEFGGFTLGLVAQEVVLTIAVAVPLVWMIAETIDRVGST